MPKLDTVLNIFQSQVTHVHTLGTYMLTLEFASTFQGATSVATREIEIQVIDGAIPNFNFEVSANNIPIDRIVQPYDALLFHADVDPLFEGTITLITFIAL